MKERIHKELADLSACGNLRSLRHLHKEGRYCTQSSGSGDQNAAMLNLSSNDYLGLSSDEALRSEFMSSEEAKTALFTSSSSRLLAGNFPEYDAFEEQLAADYGRSALVFNCGYHANTGILPALTNDKTLILADKLAHASLIDGIRLCSARCIRFRHNDLNQLEQLLDRYSSEYETIFVVVESIYSMDGDVADLKRLVGLKNRFNLMLYVDEAHGVGVRGAGGLGLAEECGCLQDVDILVGTLGKALASNGAFVICDTEIREYLINRMRSFIFTTALPPFNIAWSLFVWNKMKGMRSRREHLQRLSSLLSGSIRRITMATSHAEQKAASRNNIDTQIVPLLVGENDAAVQLACNLQKKGFFVLPVRPPTVPAGTARLRFSLTADMTVEEIESLIKVLEESLA